MTRSIDSHLHLWDLGNGGYSWLGPQHGPLFRTYTAHEARGELDAAGIAAAILVQAEDSLTDTRFMLDTAAANPWIAGVVGWVPLDNAAATQSALADLAAEEALRGVRHLVHDDPRDDFLYFPEVRKSLGLVADAGLTLDVPDAWPRHLEGTVELAQEMPALSIVVDHLGKPPRGQDDYASWEKQFRRFASLPNVSAKASGLRMPGMPYNVESVQPVWDVALEVFGPARLMYGGDWPMTVGDGGYQPTFAVLRELIEQLSEPEQDLLMAGTASRVYGLQHWTAPNI